MPKTVVCKTESKGSFAHVIEVGGHTLRSDQSLDAGGEGSGPGPHDLFDAALAACKSQTAIWYARKKGFPLETVETRIERDDSDERSGTYRLKARMAFTGPLTEEQRAKLLEIADRCPIHKLMTEVEVQIATVPLA
ncbi:MAG: OsmC family protein [Planctomycetes bacterium]|nr:OsmC family protein [Planctomycetota bacterium]